MDNCTRCGANLEMVGRAHRCVPSSRGVVAAKRAMPVEQPPVLRVKSKSYRYRDPEKRRAYMRDLMRRKRARKAAS